MKLTTTFIFCALFYQITLAQKSAPVAGDAAQLIDLLKKDYNAVNPENKDEIISRDMFKVTSIFKTYMNDQQRNDLKNTTCSQTYTSLKTITNDHLTEARMLDPRVNDKDTFCGAINDISEIYEEYELEKKKFNAMSSNSSSRINLIEDLAEYKKEFYEAKFFKDISELYQIKNSYNSNNSYLAAVVEIFIRKYATVHYNKDDINSQINYNSSVQKAAGFLGGDLAFETIIDGLSRFLVTRIKEELTTHAIEKIQNYLKNPSQKSYLNELMILLPTATDYLKSFEASQVLNFTNDFKQYIEKDLNNLLSNARNLKNTARFKALINKNPDIEFAFEALDLIPQISKIKEPLDYFKIIENSKTLNNWSNDTSKKIKFNIANGINLTSLLAHSLLVIDEGKRKLVSLDFMSDYGSEKEFYLLYIGFLQQQNNKYFNVKFTKDGATEVPLDFKLLMTKFSPDNIQITNKAFVFFKEHIINIVSNTEKLQEVIASIKRANKDDDKIKTTEVHNLIETLIEFSEEITITSDDIIREGINLGLFSNLDIDTTTIVNKTKPYFETAKKVNSIFLDLHNKNYTTAITTSLDIVNDYTHKDLSLAKLINIENQLVNASDLTLLKTFLESKSIPGNEKKKNALKDLAVLVQEIIYRPTMNMNLTAIKTQFDRVLSAIDSNENNNFKKELKQLKSDIELQYKDVLKEYAGIKLTEVFITPIHNFIDGKSINANIKTKLKTYVEDFTKNASKAYLLGEDKDLKSSKENLVRYLTVYVPELSNGIFNVKDKNVLRIIHFITDVALSNNAKDVENALESFALPAGSSSAKEKVNSYFSINSYPGILFGKEFTTNDNAEHIGITAPVGIYAQLWKSEKTTWGLFVPIIDIGAPVRFRFDDNKNTETLPDFDFNDIFSPGLYISIGLNNSPFAFNAGIQYGPKLRGIDNGSGVLTNIEAYRVGVGVVIDIPLFTLYTSGIDD
ncbi:hypothetical protein [Tenacibaculum jejuense]|uniref:Uncharacterized protein n=1 Tax=Tenacibaculum jejuense TaxID=584609 RepID=A0A238UBP7_9FLAO|nr:hypothetical protein [Tenacibaculum jejuense]SNR16637.1 Protein of unknown function precursor [Tenacibaculum jejuense]